MPSAGRCAASRATCLNSLRYRWPMSTKREQSLCARLKLLCKPANEGNIKMKHTVMLTVASLLSILFFTLHLTDDIVRGFEPGTLRNLSVLPICVVWLYGTLVLAERRSGYVIMLLGSVLGLIVPIVHMM